MRMYLPTRFQVSSIRLTGFRQEVGGGGVILPLPTTKRIPEKSTQIRINLFATWCKISRPHLVPEPRPPLKKYVLVVKLLEN